MSINVCPNGVTERLHVALVFRVWWFFKWAVLIVFQIFFECMSMALCKTVTPLLMHWSYCSLALSHQCILYITYPLSRGALIDLNIHHQMCHHAGYCPALWLAQCFTLKCKCILTGTSLILNLQLWSGAIITRSFFFQIPHNSHPIARPWGQAMGCQLWIQILIHVLFQ